MKPVCNRPALLEIIFISLEIPSGPNLSITPMSPFFQKKEPIFFKVTGVISSSGDSPGR